MLKENLVSCLTWMDEFYNSVCEKLSLFSAMSFSKVTLRIKFQCDFFYIVETIRNFQCNDCDVHWDSLFFRFYTWMNIFSITFKLHTPFIQYENTQIIHIGNTMYFHPIIISFYTKRQQFPVRIHPIIKLQVKQFDRNSNKSQNRHPIN